MRRISVTGNSGSGKTTLAREIGARLELPVLELDEVFHQPGWVERDRNELRDEVTAFCAGDGWVVDGNREPLANLWPGHPGSIIRWSWTQHGKFRHRYLDATTDPALAHLRWVRLRSRTEARTWLDALR